MRFYEAPAGSAFGSLAWVASARYFAVTVFPFARETRSDLLHSLDPRSGTLRLVDFRPDADCPLQSSEHPEALGGHLIFISRCFGNLTRPTNEFTSVLDVNLATGTTRRWRRYSVPILTNALAVAPDGHTALINDARGFSDHLRRLDAKRLSPPLPLRWSAAGAVSWSPDGRWIAADGVRRTRVVGPFLLSEPRELVLIDSQGRIRRRLLKAESSVFTAWAPDSKRLAFVGEPAGELNGLYLLDVESGEHRLMLKGDDFWFVEWMDDSQVAVVVGGDESDPRHGLLLLTLRDEDRP